MKKLKASFIGEVAATYQLSTKVTAWSHLENKN